MPSTVDSNSPSFWRDGQLHLINSTGGNPSILSKGDDVSHLGTPEAIKFKTTNPWPTWMEATWVDPGGAIFGWYHQEHWGVCYNSRLAVPQIGAAVSMDGGASFQDLGGVLISGDGTDCTSQNGYIAGGHGDLSVILDRDKKYFYILFTNYAGPVRHQGVGVARMAYADRWSPAGAVWKYHKGEWMEPGILGKMTAIFPAKVSWQAADTDSFWGPAIHWNTYLEQYVMLLNRSCCSPGFPEEGVYVSFNADLSKPEDWKRPKKILEDTGWYPEAIGGGANGTDTEAGRVARLFMYGHSRWEIVFKKPAEEPEQQ